MNSNDEVRDDDMDTIVREVKRKRVDTIVHGPE